MHTIRTYEKLICHMLIVISILLAAYINSEALNDDSRQEIPQEWLPKEALEAAEKSWEHQVGCITTYMLEHNYGISDRNDALNVEFKHPHRVVNLKYSNYESNVDYSSLIDDSRIFTRNAYGFGVYHDNESIGSIIVYFDEEKWRLLEGSSCGGICDDFLGAIYDQTPSDCRLYQQRDGAFFIVNNDDKIVAVYEYIIKDRTYKYTDPDEYMTRIKERIELEQDGK